jgi:N-methylhydantoinase B
MAESAVGTSPITTEILRNAFVSIAEDMNAALIRSAYSPLIYEGKDCAVGLLDHDGNVLGQSLGVPLFLGNLSLCVQMTAELHGWDFFQDGDVIFLNDSYIAGTHLNDVTVIQPIFWRGQRVGFAASRAHWLDVGGKDTGLSIDSTEIYQEGMRWAPTKIYDAGRHSGFPAPEQPFRRSVDRRPPRPDRRRRDWRSTPARPHGSLRARHRPGRPAGDLRAVRAPRA